MENKKAVMIAVALVVLAAIAGGAYFLGQRQGPLENTSVEETTPTPSVTGSITPTLSPSPSPTKKPTPTPTNKPSPTPTPTPGVINIETSVSPTTSNTCNQKFDITAKIYTNAALDITFKWLRSDGAGAPTEALTFTEAGVKTVTRSWTLGQASGNHYNGWERVEILTPLSALSNKAEFTLSCP